LSSISVEPVKEAISCPGNIARIKTSGWQTRQVPFLGIEILEKTVSYSGQFAEIKTSLRQTP